MMYSRDNLLEAVTMVSFIMSLANYSENLDQSSAQDMLNNVVKDIHKHLQQQDNKIDKILELVGGSDNA